MQTPQPARLTALIRKVSTENARIVVNNNAAQAQYTVAKIPDHNHDGTNSSRINYQSLIGGLSSGVLAPTTIPYQIGQMYINTATKKVYISCGTRTASDWQLLN